MWVPTLNKWSLHRGHCDSIRYSTRSLAGRAVSPPGFAGGGTVDGQQYTSKQCYIKALELNDQHAVAWFRPGLWGGGSMRRQQYLHETTVLRQTQQKHNEITLELVRPSVIVNVLSQSEIKAETLMWVHKDLFIQPRNYSSPPQRQTCRANNDSNALKSTPLITTDDWLSMTCLPGWISNEFNNKTDGLLYWGSV